MLHKVTFLTLLISFLAPPLPFSGKGDRAVSEFFLAPFSPLNKELLPSAKLSLVVGLARNFMHDLNNSRVGLEFMEPVHPAQQVQKDPQTQEAIQEIVRLKPQLGVELQEAHKHLHLLLQNGQNGNGKMAKDQWAWARIRLNRAVALYLEIKKYYQRIPPDYFKRVPKNSRGLNYVEDAILHMELRMGGLSAVLDLMNESCAINERDLDSFLNYFFNQSLNSLKPSPLLNYQYLYRESVHLNGEKFYRKINLGAFLAPFLAFLSSNNSEEKEPAIAMVETETGENQITLKVTLKREGKPAQTRHFLLPPASETEASYSLLNVFSDSKWKITADLRPQIASVSAPAGGEAVSGDDAITEEGTTVLLVDDEEIVLEMNEAVLSRFGYSKIVKALSSHAGLEEFKKIRSRRVLVVTDFSMPGKSGIQLAGEIREIARKRGQTVQIMMITGNAAENRRGKTFVWDAKSILQDASAIDFILNKPYEITHFLDRACRMQEILDAVSSFAGLPLAIESAI